MAKKQLDLTELAILVSLHDGIKHGYEIMKYVQEHAEMIGATSLYRKIHGLNQDGLLKEVPAPVGETDPRKRYYELTAIGECTAKAELKRLDSFIQTAKPAFGAGFVFRGV